jgi:ubiquinone/menaquinone biosynthesis C-methylase UbiE
MVWKKKADLHDKYAAEYDNQVKVFECYLTDVLFGLCYEYIQPGQHLLDAGIGSGLSSALFARAGLEVYGMDFSPTMLEICLAKGFAAELTQHDVAQIPWPYPIDRFDHLMCCGVLHFLSDLETVFGEMRRVLRKGGVCAFTTKIKPAINFQQKYERDIMGEFEIYSHALEYIEDLLDQYSFKRLKLQKCYVGEDIFAVWIIQKN